MTDLLLGSTTLTMPATSGSYNFSVTRDDIIRQGMMNLGLLEEQEVPTAVEVSDCARVLNMIIKQLVGNNDKAPGFKMWQRQRGDLFLGLSKFLYNLGATGDNWADSTSGLIYPTIYGQHQLGAAVAINGTVLPITNTAGMNIGDFIGVVLGSDTFWTTISGVTLNTSVTIPAPGLSAAASGGAYVWNYTTKAQRPAYIKTCILRDINNTDTDMRILTLEEYEALPTKVQPGFISDPSAIYYEPQMQNNIGQLYLDVAGAQDVTKHLHMVYLRESQDFDNPGDAPEYPQEWYLHLCWSLSLQICGMFDGEWTPDRQAAYSVAITRASEANPQTTNEFFQVDDE